MPVMASDDVRVGIGIGAETCDVVLELGDLHPSGHGAFRLGCSIDEDRRVVSADPQPGLLHRGTEKLLEVRDYRQALMLANRHDWLSAVTSEITLALAVEELLGLEVPPRAVWLRTLLCEISRAAASLMHLAGAAALPPHGRQPADVPGMRAREALLRCLESISGGRMHTMIARIGGLAADAPPGWFDEVSAAVGLVRSEISELRDAVDATIAPGIARLSRADALGYSVNGPVARASGLDIDLRRDDPSLAYAELASRVTVCTSDEGDARARYRVLAQQVAADLDLLEACIAGVPAGPVDVPLPKVVRAPEGSAYAWMESATGINGVYLVSTGGTTPWRVRLRTASYANVQAMSSALPGTGLDDLAAAVGSFMFVAGDLDH